MSGSDRERQPDPGALETLGIHRLDEAHAEARTECLRVARRLRHAGKQVVGLLPASSEVAVMPVGVQLTLALAEVTGAAVAFVDANARWPALAPLAFAGAERTRDDETTFATRWLHETAALLIPKHQGEAGAGVPGLERLLPEARQLFASVLVDLTGFDTLGEHLAAADRIDGVVIVGAAGKTRERELLDRSAELPAGAALGVLLVGGRPA